MSLFEDIFSKLTLKEVGIHLGNYSSLYTNPLKVWKKSISFRKEGYNLIILHLIYYCIFIYFIVKEITLAIPITILEIVLTVIPFSFFVIPFLIFKWTYKKHYSWKNLFRLLIIIKLQLIPLLLLLILLAKSSTAESLYVITDNFIWLLWIAFIIVFPLIVKIAFWKKGIWILTNYFFFLIAILLLGFSLEKIDKTGSMFSKLSILSPNTEFSNFESKGLYSPLLFDDRYYFVLAEMKNDSSTVVSKPQFVNSEFRLLFLTAVINKLKSAIKLIDSSSNSFSKHGNIMNKKINSNYDIMDFTLPILDSFRTDLNSKYSLLLSETIKMKDSAKFESNRKYFQILTDYLKSYENSYKDSGEISKIINTSTIEGTVKIDAKNVGVMFRIDPAYYDAKKNKLQLVEANFSDRSSKSTFLLDILLYPLNIIIE